MLLTIQEFKAKSNLPTFTFGKAERGWKNTFETNENGENYRISLNTEVITSDISKLRMHFGGDKVAANGKPYEQWYLVGPTLEF